MKKTRNILRMMCLLTVMLQSNIKTKADVEPKGLPVLEVKFNGSSMPKSYTKGTMSLTYTDGSKVELNAKFKARGATAQQYSMKPSFNMKLRDANGKELDSTLCGLRSQSSWILDAMAVDRIGMRNRVAFDIWNAYSRLPYDTKFDSRNGTVGEFIEVYINNEYKGIYCLTDRVNRKLLDLKKPDIIDTTATGEPLVEPQVVIRGVLYKHGTNDIADQNTPGVFSEDSVAYVIRYHDTWELTEPEDYAGKAAWAPLDTLYMFNNNYEWVKEHYYLEQLAEYQVFIMAMSISDNWGNKNSYIGARNVTTDGNKHRFVYTPWDLDCSLGGRYDGSYYDGHYSDWKPSQIVSASTMPIPFSVCNRQQEFKNLLRGAWIKGRSGALAVDSVRDRLYEYRDLFINTGAWQRATTYWDSQRYKPCYVNDLAKEIDYIVTWYTNRFAEMDEYFNIDPSNIATSPKADTHDTPTYNLKGQRITHPSPREIYIQQGKKFIKQ